LEATLRLWAIVVIVRRRRRMDREVCLYKRGTQHRDLGIIEVGPRPS